jgi:hypothetical protein
LSWRLAYLVSVRHIDLKRIDKAIESTMATSGIAGVLHANPSGAWKRGALLALFAFAVWVSV